MSNYTKTKGQGTDKNLIYPYSFNIFWAISTLNYDSFEDFNWVLEPIYMCFSIKLISYLYLVSSIFNILFHWFKFSSYFINCTNSSFYSLINFSLYNNRANAAPISGTGYTVKNLPKGKEFEFRVIPVNAAGQGEPSEPTKFIKVQKPISKWKSYIVT